MSTTRYRHRKSLHNTSPVTCYLFTPTSSVLATSHRVLGVRSLHARPVPVSRVIQKSRLHAHDSTGMKYFSVKLRKEKKESADSRSLTSYSLTSVFKAERRSNVVLSGMTPRVAYAKRTTFQKKAVPLFLLVEFSMRFGGFL